MPEDSAGLDGVKRLGLDADHFRINKFSSIDDPNYVTVLQQLREMIQKAPDRVKSRLSREWIDNWLRCTITDTRQHHPCLLPTKVSVTSSA